ncbi:MAG: ParB N-terminal domain-containing protein [Pseudomonadota bacterium]
MTQIHDIPVTQIERDALPRDRSHMDAEANQELARSIEQDGLRQPIEVWAFKTPHGGFRYGLISGHRRLDAVQGLAARPDHPGTIKAFIRTPETIPQAMADMIAENEIRAQITPWDRARTIIDAVAEGIFATPDEGIMALHPTGSTQKNSRLRTLCSVVEVFRHILRQPHGLSERKLLRLAALERADLLQLAFEAIRRHKPKSTEATYQLLMPIIDEAEQILAGNTRLRRPRNPIRSKPLANNLHIRREFRADGWALLMTGPNATGVMVKEVMDEIIWKLSAPD